jgi:surfactin synthase thioesterase subunit
VQLPGRGKRHREPFLANLAQVADALVRLLAPRLADAPWAVVGHSMGCWAGHAFISGMEQAGVRPCAVFVAACFPAPDLSLADRPWHANRGLSEEAFKDECRGWGIAESVLATPHQWEPFKTMIRADFTLFDQHAPQVASPLLCPIAGSEASLDGRITPAHLAGWARFTTATRR